MEFSTDLPWSMAVTDAPLPRWQEIIFSDSKLTPRCALAALAEATRIELAPAEDGAGVLCDGRDVSDEIRTPEVTESIFRLADEPGVRHVLIEQQRRMAKRRDLVAEGRDQGTDVFPDARVKFYLDAPLRERARRRMEDLHAGGREGDRDEVTAQMAARDARDRMRPMGALRQRDDMMVIDSMDMTVDEVVEAMAVEVARRCSAPEPDDR